MFFLLAPSSPAWLTSNRIYGYKKSGGFVLTHLLSGSAKPLTEMKLETITPRRNMQLQTAVSRMHTNYIQTRVLPDSHPSFF